MAEHLVVPSARLWPWSSTWTRSARSATICISCSIQIIVLGLVTSKVATLGDLDLLKRRTDEATRYIDLDRLAISPQCGFASTVAGNPVSEADQRAKLRLVVTAAKRIWR
jgi:methionine synthase II (cobalamin-independent)